MVIKIPIINHSSEPIAQNKEVNKKIEQNIFSSGNLTRKSGYLNPQFHNSLLDPDEFINSKNYDDGIEKTVPQKLNLPKNATEPLKINFFRRESILSKPIEAARVANSLIQLINLKDSYTGQHSKKVKSISEKFAKKLNLSKFDEEIITLGAAFHDIGKIGVEESILNNPLKLSDEEFKKIQEHPVIGAKILEGLPCFNGEVSRIVKHHHENWDGSGYPDRLSGLKIPLGARIISIADSYHAMTSNRPYRDALGNEEALKRLKKGAGKQWDPYLIEKFLKGLN